MGWKSERRKTAAGTILPSCRYCILRVLSQSVEHPYLVLRKGSYRSVELILERI